MLNGNSMYFYVFWELIYFYVICIYVIWETTNFSSNSRVLFCNPPATNFLVGASWSETRLL